METKSYTETLKIEGISFNFLASLINGNHAKYTGQALSLHLHF